jgi:RING-H2 zinc finger domain
MRSHFCRPRCALCAGHSLTSLALFVVCAFYIGGIQEECAICKCGLTRVCIECEAQQAIGAEDAISAGCSSTFSLHLSPLTRSVYASSLFGTSSCTHSLAERALVLNSLPLLLNSLVLSTPVSCGVVSWGECQHAFHHHCISRWLEKGLQTCPLDQAPWRFARIEQQNA